MSKYSPQVEALHKELAEFEKTAGGKAMTLRLDLAALLWNFTSEELMSKLGWGAKRVERLLNAGENWDSETLGRIAAALDLDLGLVEKQE